MRSENSYRPPQLLGWTIQPQRLPPAFKLLVDLGLWALALPLAALIRYDGAVPGTTWDALPALAALLIGTKLVFYVHLGLYRQSWVHVTLRDVRRISLVMMAVGLFATLPLVLGFANGIPRSLALLDALFSVGLMAAARATARLAHEEGLTRRAAAGDRRRVLIVGAGEAGSLIARELRRHPETGLLPVGFLDDDPGKVGQHIITVPVLGTLDDLEKVLHSRPVDEVLIAMPSADGRSVRSIIERINDTGLNVKSRIFPGVFELLSGRVNIQRIRNVEIEDLLRREPVRLDTEAILGYLRGKTVMITGAGGSIGSELVRQICRFEPKELILFGHGENSIYQLERELDRDWPEVTYRSVIGAIQNAPRLEYIFRRYGPQVIFHTAAHKHVPLMESNPEEAVFNNIIGSRNLVQLALRYGVSHFVNISTDKAVNPTSVMGASKRMVEYIVQDAARRAGPDQTFVSVRFGNVLGSRGSVIPVFKRQIRAGGPVTVTHPDMVRYFMTIPEAAQLVLQASGNGRNGEIYILDMGEPVRIVDLARDLIRLSGLEPDVDIPIEFSGIRPGEKLYEELLASEERIRDRTPHEKIFVAKVKDFDPARLQHSIERLQDTALTSDHDGIRAHLAAFIEGCRFDPPANDERVRA